ncbi:MAG: flagellar biosynthetic protein FliQ [Bacillota bacterium]|uniref:Flagellar biosynthetic protein FliQ n=1 Tax=[Clostridium] aminophilum TaxID=1526 RepID=A0A1I6IUP0_9FIRM|nr:flagellar biosynthetic protein FliQ [[Clostridium] aminophilum]MCR4629021.1 flagellar type III secretion system protein FliQ [Clostridium sp.]MDT3844639.1 flagellar biosynthetic protein FliQ [Bacillota bacterium]SFR70389.1 flagellar biosynthetic protein FliQ [[Clostridium] aminophilum]
MSSGDALDIMYQTFRLAAEIALPLLLVSLIVGIIIALFSAATQINEQTLTFVPKLIAIGLILAVLGSTILAKMQDFATMVFAMIATG